MKNINNLKLLPKILLFTFFFSLLTKPLLSNAYTFTRNLTIGDEGEDVKQLQIFLNNYSSDTKISNSGVGSPGNETSYFGALTKNALINFQNINSKSILSPAGLTYGTGYFGASTRNFINSSNNNSNANLNLPEGNKESSLKEINNQTKTETVTSNTNPIYLFLSKRIALENDEINVGSSETISNLSFYLNEKELDKKCKTDFFCILKINGLSKGEYTLRTSSDQIKTELVKIVDSKKPKISTKNIKLNADNKITGKNLSNKIKIYTSFGMAETETQNNSFILQIQSNLTEIPEYLSKGPIYIENEDGIISDIIIVNYEI